MKREPYTLIRQKSRGRSY